MKDHHTAYCSDHSWLQLRCYVANFDYELTCLQQLAMHLVLKCLGLNRLPNCCWSLESSWPGPDSAICLARYPWQSNSLFIVEAAAADLGALSGDGFALQN